MNANELAGLLQVFLKAKDHHDPAVPVEHDVPTLAKDAAAVQPAGGLEAIFKALMSNPQIVLLVVGLLTQLLNKSKPAPAPAPAPPTPSAPPATPAQPAADGKVYPDEIELVSVDASHPNHGEIVCKIEDGVVKPASLGTDSFDDNTDFVLHLGYKLNGQPIHFDHTPNASHLKHTSRLEFRVGGRAGVARLDATRLESGGFMADGGQIRKRYDETVGMDPTIKFPAKPTGPNSGEILTLTLFAPDGGGDEVSRRYTFAPFN